MTTINPYSSLGVSTAGTTATTNTKTLGQDDFLKLMTAQMTHQDPTQPMSNGDFLAQMAQFGTVNGIQSLNTAFSSFATSMTSNQALQAASLVGRTVTTSSNQGLLSAGGTVAGNVNLTGSSQDVAVQVIDPATGSVIRNMDLGSQSAGTVPFSWNGNNNAGTPANPGVYQIQVQSLVNGANTALTPNIQSQVASVSMGTQGVQVNLVGGLGSVNLSQISQIL
jgi:flagellar basal-body rod modification protein FlgD